MGASTGDETTCMLSQSVVYTASCLASNSAVNNGDGKRHSADAGGGDYDWFGETASASRIGFRCMSTTNVDLCAEQNAHNMLYGADVENDGLDFLFDYTAPERTSAASAGKNRVCTMEAMAMPTFYGVGAYQYDVPTNPGTDTEGDCIRPPPSHPSNTSSC